MLSSSLKDRDFLKIKESILGTGGGFDKKNRRLFNKRLRKKIKKYIKTSCDIVENTTI